jgi:protein involved in polysaccharide export with SLBB domain
MTKFKLIACGITAIIFLTSCSKILEPISLYGAKQNILTEAEQEEFKINIKSLTFDAAKKANTAPYSRRLISTGSGSRANVLDETNFLKSNFPKPSNNTKYLLGIGDQISFTLLNEFETKTAQWPINSKETDYLLGPGDKLTFTQSNDRNQKKSNFFDVEGNDVRYQNNDEIIYSDGIIGTNGNILLYGLGNILAANRTLEDLRTEVRNILIREGLAPNFQLDISDFKSKKAYLTINDLNFAPAKLEDQIIFIDNLPISLSEIALRANLSISAESFALIKLTRNGKEFRFTAGQLLNLAAPEIIIKDKDRIEIISIKDRSITDEAVVGSKGNILLPNVGNISAMNQSIDDLHKEISTILIRKGMKPNFQLELKGVASKKIYLIQKNIGSVVVPLIDANTTLRQLLFESNKISTPANNLAIITLKRDGQAFQMTGEQILDPKNPDISVADEDHIEIEYLAYKPAQVFALGGAGRAEMVTIDPSRRETLADILFTPKGALNSLVAKLSEVYLLRGQDPSVAYHLDAQNVSRILVAAKTELRPNDIVYVADRPIISFSRTLAEINPLRILLRDLQNGNIP